MWTCQKCGKPVYFAERRQSLGFNWHPNCLKCEECGKILNPGTHAEHRGVPYCHVPCYAALFGPKLFGHGSTTESHRSFGRRENSFIREKNELKTKLDEYNNYYNKVTKNQISSREVNGRFVLEGIIKVYWGTEASVRLKEFDDTRVININNRNRKAISVGPDFIHSADLNIKCEIRAESEDVEDGDTTDNDQDQDSLPYFNPRTHPLFRESLLELNKTFTDPFYDKLLDQAMLEDVNNDNLLSYDPIQKWKTVNNLVGSSDNLSECLTQMKITEPEESSTQTTIFEQSNYEKLSRSMSVHNQDINKNSSLVTRYRSLTLPTSFKNVKDDLDDLLQVERRFEDHERLYHTVNSASSTLHSPDNVTKKFENSEKDLDLSSNNKSLDESLKFKENNSSESSNNNNPTKSFNVESRIEESVTGRKFIVEKLDESSCKDNGESPAPVRLRNKKQESTDEETKKHNRKSQGPRALRRRHGKKMDKNKLKRRSSINGHWYDRDTSVFTPPKHTAMCVYSTSKMSPTEVVTALLDKYKIESSPGDYALYVVKESGETRLVGPSESPLTLRVNLGPHEEISKLYLMDKHKTTEIPHEVAQYLNFSYAELRSFLNMFYEEEEREADRIRTKYLVIKRRLQYVMRLKQGQGQVFQPTEPVTG